MGQFQTGASVRVKPGVMGVNRMYAGRTGTLESPVDISTVAMVLDGAQSAEDPEWVVRFSPTETAIFAESDLEAA